MEPKKTKKEKNTCLTADSPALQALLDMQDDIDLPSKAETLAAADQRSVINRDNYLDDYLYESKIDQSELDEFVEYDDIEMEDYWI